MSTPTTSEAWARQLINTHFEDIFRWAKEDFFATLSDEQCNNPGDELLERWNTLFNSYYERGVEETRRRIEDAVYRACQNKGFTEGYNAMVEKAAQGDSEALLKLQACFPDLNEHEPFRTLIRKAREEDPDFRKKWEAIPRTPSIHGNLNTLQLTYLSLHIHLVKDCAAGRMRIDDLAEKMVDEAKKMAIEGLAPTNYETFGKFLHRHFADIFKAERPHDSSTL